MRRRCGSPSMPRHGTPCGGPPHAKMKHTAHMLCSGSGDLKKFLDNYTYGWPSEDKFLYTANGTEVGSRRGRAQGGRAGQSSGAAPRGMPRRR